eukprot:TRINITY_DN8776_c0_g1_i1.p1 TRINITY_DN8776_c0_g1~~TRINITY_DN8776_c0_g1_i1.p1  ORF type:complete len:372 (-),score=122.15 TRINITY_DN8776_c0_g1_i1:587-1702(-)
MVEIWVLSVGFAKDIGQGRAAEEKQCNGDWVEVFNKEVVDYVSEIRPDAVVRGFLMTLDNFQAIIDSAPADALVVNLCDGCDVDGTPGPCVMRALSKRGLRYTGASVPFFHISTYKWLMKSRFAANGVGYPRGITVFDDGSPLVEQSFEIGHLSADICQEGRDWTYVSRLRETFSRVEMTFPLFLKPADSYASVGIDSKLSIAHDFAAVESRVNSLLRQGFQAIIIEEFIEGGEYTVAVLESRGLDGERVVTAHPSQRDFRGQSAQHKFMSWTDDDVWIVDVEDKSMIEPLKQIAIASFHACEGNAYARVDIRRNNATGTLHVLEVNANCALGKGCVTDNVLSLAGVSMRDFFKTLLDTIQHLPVGPQETG